MIRLAAMLSLFAAAPTMAAVPISLAPTGHAMVPVNGPFGTRQFVFDTGAEGSAIYAGLAEEAELKVVGSETLQGQTGAVETALVRLASLAVDGVAKGPLDAVRLDARADGVPLAGIVGLDMFGDRLVDFDLPRRSLSLLPSGARPAGLSGDGLKATPTTGGLLTVPVTIGRTQAVAVIDTGARKTRINWALGKLLGFTPETIARGDIIQGATNSAIETGATRVRDVRLGRRALGEAPVLVADLPVFAAFGVADRASIILGLDWLEQTRMVVDFPARLVWFEESVPQPLVTAE